MKHKGHIKTIIMLITEKRDDIKLLQLYANKFPEKRSEYEKSIRILESQIDVLQDKVKEC